MTSSPHRWTQHKLNLYDNIRREYDTQIGFFFLQKIFYKLEDHALKFCNGWQDAAIFEKKRRDVEEYFCGATKLSFDPFYRVRTEMILSVLIPQPANLC